MSTQISFFLLHFQHSSWNLETFLQPFTCPLTCVDRHLAGPDGFPLKWALTFFVCNALPPITLGSIHRNHRTVFSISPFSPEISWPRNVISNVAYTWARSTMSRLIFILLVILLLTSSFVFLIQNLSFSISIRSFNSEPSLNFQWPVLSMRAGAIFLP